MSSFVAQIMAPGGGVLLLPFVKAVVGVLMLTVLGIFIAGVARIHMAILAFLSGGLLVSLTFFEKEFKKQSARRESGGSGPTSAPSSNKVAAKTD